MIRLLQIRGSNSPKLPPPLTGPPALDTLTLTYVALRSYMPQNPTIIATKSPSPDVLIFDYTQHPSEPVEDSGINYQMKLTGHTKEGYGLSWNTNSRGLLLSASDDQTVCMWDVEGGGSKGQKTLEAQAVFRGHQVGRSLHAFVVASELYLVLRFQLAHHTIMPTNLPVTPMPTVTPMPNRNLDAYPYPHTPVPRASWRTCSGMCCTIRCLALSATTRS